MRNLPKVSKARSTKINKLLLRQRESVRVYSGTYQKTYTINLIKDMKGHSLGEFAYTKSLGSQIHDSAKNQKKKKKK